MPSFEEYFYANVDDDALHEIENAIKQYGRGKDREYYDVIRKINETSLRKSLPIIFNKIEKIGNSSNRYAKLMYIINNLKHARRSSAPSVPVIMALEIFSNNYQDDLVDKVYEAIVEHFAVLMDFTIIDPFKIQEYVISNVCQFNQMMRLKNNNFWKVDRHIESKQDAIVYNIAYYNDLGSLLQDVDDEFYRILDILKAKYLLLQLRDSNNIYQDLNIIKNRRAKAIPDMAYLFTNYKNNPSMIVKELELRYLL